MKKKQKSWGMHLQHPVGSMIQCWQLKLTSPLVAIFVVPGDRLSATFHDEVMDITAFDTRVV